tara:strand:+ start:1436 stop:1708 length:273 start_codon:yes stop_codon:yes gene_type:complete
MIKPVNRYIHIEVIENEKKTATGIVLPEDYNPTKQRYVTAKVVACAQDVRFREDCRPGDKVVVEGSMIEKILINNVSLTVVQDNYVIGIV